MFKTDRLRGCGCKNGCKGNYCQFQKFQVRLRAGLRVRGLCSRKHFRAVAAQSSAGVVAARDEAPESVSSACARYPSIFPIIPPSTGPVRRFLHTATAQDHRVSLPCQRVPRAQRHPHALPACPGVGVGLQPGTTHYNRASRVLLAAVRAGKAALLGPAALLARRVES